MTSPASPPGPAPNPPNPARANLLREVITWVSQHGLTDASLREIATGIGTSHRMLIYHFGSRAGLIAALVTAMEQQQRETLSALAEQGSTPTDVVRRHWALLTQPEVLPFVRLFYELAALTAHQREGTTAFREDFIAPWLAAGREAAQAVGAAAEDAEIRGGVALLRGLLLDVLITGELAAATAALEAYLANLELETA